LEVERMWSLEMEDPDNLMSLMESMLRRQEVI
jgi:hypothetical protein